MAKRVLVNGRVTKSETCQKELSYGTVVNVCEFTYEFEYGGMVYEGKGIKGAGTDSKEMPGEGSIIQVYFYPDTKKWIMKQENGKPAIGMKARNLFLILLIMVTIYIILTECNVEAFPKGIAVLFYAIGISFPLKEILFFIDKKSGKYSKVAARFKGYDVGHGNSGFYYQKSYILNDTGELYTSPIGTSIKGNMEIGQEVFLYRHNEYGTLIECTNFLISVFWLFSWVIIGTAVAFYMF